MFVRSSELTLSFPAPTQPINDLQTHTLYLVQSDVSLLPLRRVLLKHKLVRESLILLGDLAPTVHNLLLRIKHVALDFLRDFNGSRGVVPGLRIIGKIPLKHAVMDQHRGFDPADKLLVFPFSTCWAQGSDDPCANCVCASKADLLAYETHRQWPCSRNLAYGVSLHGGLQDYIRVPLPAHLLVKIPERVSVHDACFLFDVALQFHAYCHDVLVPLLALVPQGRILVLLNDVEKEANDCLVVIHLLLLDHLLFTFTDMARLTENPLLRDSYANKFTHVLVFPSLPAAFQTAVLCGVSTGLELTSARHTIALFAPEAPLASAPSDRTVHRVRLSYKDKFLFEKLLGCLADLNSGRATTTHKASLISMNTINSANTVLTNYLNLSESVSEGSTDSSSGSAKRKRIRFRETPDVVSAPSARKHILWLHCDRDYRLCLDDNCEHDSGSRCHLTDNINEMIADGCQLKRVFYTHRPATHVKLNAFIF